MAKKKRYLLLSLVLLTILTVPCLALEMGISPPDITLQIAPGQTYSGEILVYGSENETIEISVVKHDWSLTTAGEYQFLPMGTVKRSASPWVSFAVNRLTIPPKRGQRLQYTVKVPAGASGSYWGAIMFTSVPANSGEKPMVQLTTAGRIAYILKIDVNGSPPAVGNIDRFKLNWLSETKKVAAAFRIKNSGASFLRFKGRLEVRDRQGVIVYVIPFNEGLILPDSIHEFGLRDYNFNFKPGYYVALAVADLGDKSMKAMQTTFEVK